MFHGRQSRRFQAYSTRTQYVLKFTSHLRIQITFLSSFLIDNKRENSRSPNQPYSVRYIAIHDESNTNKHTNRKISRDGVRLVL